MQPTMCSRCGKNVAVVFITKIENGQAKNEGLCLKCARELHIKPVDDMINKMGITDDELDNLTGEMMSALTDGEDIAPVDDDGSDEEDDGKTATFPFLNRLFGGGPAPRHQTRARTRAESRAAARLRRIHPRAASASSLIITASTSPPAPARVSSIR